MARDVGAVIHQLRKKCGLTLRDAGREAGVSSAYLSQIENGHRPASANVLTRLAPVLGVPVEHLLRSGGMLDDTPTDADLDHSFRYVMDDPTFEWGHRLATPIKPADVPYEVKLLVVRMYERLRNKRLLSGGRDEEGDDEGPTPT